MSTMRCCSAWKLPIATPNCLRVFRYSSVVSFSAAHDADGLGAHRRGAAVERVLDRRSGVAGHAEPLRIGADAHIAQQRRRPRALPSWLR